MELLWQNGQVVVQSQNQRSLKKSPPSGVEDAVIPVGQSSHQHHHHHNHHPHHLQNQQHHHHQQSQENLFMQEDEMASWLQYPLNDNFDSDFCADLLYPTPCVTSTSTAVTAAVRTAQLIESPQMNPMASASASAPRPPIPPPRRTENFGIFSRHRARSEPSNSKIVVVRDSTVVDSSETPAICLESRVSEAMRNTEAASGAHNVCRTVSSAGGAGTSSAVGEGGGTVDLAGADGRGGTRDSATCEMTVTSSPGGSSASAEPPQKPPTEDRKRKGSYGGDDECHSEVSCSFWIFTYCGCRFFQFSMNSSRLSCAGWVTLNTLPILFLSYFLSPRDT